MCVDRGTTRASDRESHGGRRTIRERDLLPLFLSPRGARAATRLDLSTPFSPDLLMRVRHGPFRRRRSHGGPAGRRAFCGEASAAIGADNLFAPLTAAAARPARGRDEEVAAPSAAACAANPLLEVHTPRLKRLHRLSPLRPLQYAPAAWTSTCPRRKSGIRPSRTRTALRSAEPDRPSATSAACRRRRVLMRSARPGTAPASRARAVRRSAGAHGLTSSIDRRVRRVEFEAAERERPDAASSTGGWRTGEQAAFAEGVHARSASSGERDARQRRRRRRQAGGRRSETRQRRREGRAATRGHPGGGPDGALPANAPMQQARACVIFLLQPQIEWSEWRCDARARRHPPWYRCFGRLAAP